MRKQISFTKPLAISLAVLLTAIQFPASAFADEGNSISIAGSTYNYSTNALDSYTQIGTSGVYYKLTEGSGLSGNLYGTTNLTYKEFYLDNVNSTDSFDAVTTATTNKYSVLSNAWTDYEKESAEAAGGYHVKGVSNVNVAVDSELYVQSAILKNASKDLTTTYEKASNITLNENPTQEPVQYKTLEKDGTYTSNYKTIATVTDAVPTLTTASTWGEYEISVSETSTKYLRNTREDAGFAVGSNTQGIILETTDGYKVGLEHLANIWVQPYKLSFNVDNESATTGIAKSDNTAAFKKLLNKTISKITYITPEGNYTYSFADGIFIKPAYTDEVTGFFSDDLKTFTLNNIPSVKNGLLSVTYTIGSGRNKTSYSLYSGSISKNVSLDFSSITENAEEGTYSVDISSDDYVNISVTIPVTESQKETLNSLIKQAESILNGTGADDSVLLAHKNEAEELLKHDDSTSANAANLINELTELLKPYQQDETPTPTPAPTSAPTPTPTPDTDKTTPAKVTLSKQSITLKPSGKKSIKVSWKKDNAASGYEITYSTKKSFKGKKTVVIKNNNTTNKVIKNLVSKKKYFVKVRSYKQDEKSKNYGTYSSIKNIKVK